MSPLEAAKLIVKRDRAFRPLVKLAGHPPRQRAVAVELRYAALVRSITFQLLATNAASTIHQRIIALCDGQISVLRVLEIGPDELRSVGLSSTKARAMVELAECVQEGRVNLARHGRMSDAAVVANVSSVRGIGPWTAHMYLMFTLARPDVWPTGDYGVRNGWTIVHDLDELVSESELRNVSEDFVGVRTALSWYCWRAVDLAKAAR